MAMVASIVTCLAPDMLVIEIDEFMILFSFCGGKFPYSDTHCLIYEASVKFQVHFKSRGNLEAGMDTLNIGELAEKVGIRTSAIRFYESVGLLPKPPRQSGWRRYDPSTVDRLQVIHAAREVGFSVEEIRTLLNGFPKTTSPSKRWQKLAKHKLPDLEATIQRTLALKYLIEAGIECNCDDIALCINSEGLACKPTPKGSKNPPDPDDCNCD